MLQTKVLNPEEMMTNIMVGIGGPGFDNMKTKQAEDIERDIDKESESKGQKVQVKLLNLC